MSITGLNSTYLITYSLALLGDLRLSSLITSREIISIIRAVSTVIGVTLIITGLARVVPEALEILTGIDSSNSLAL